MTDDEKQFLERLQAGDEPAWAQFVEVMMPMIRSKLKYLSDDAEKIEDVANDMMVGFIANFRKAMGQPEPERKYIRPLDDRLTCTLSARALKPEYQHTPLENITIDMLAIDPPEPGIVIRLERSGPAKVLRHDRANVSYAGQIFESIGQATAAIQDSWKATPELATGPARPQ